MGLIHCTTLVASTMRSGYMMADPVLAVLSPGTLFIHPIPIDPLAHLFLCQVQCPYTLRPQTATPMSSKSFWKKAHTTTQQTSMASHPRCSCVTTVGLTA